jgi:hypothetical protein
MGILRISAPNHPTVIFSTNQYPNDYLYKFNNHDRKLFHKRAIRLSLFGVPQ